MLLEKKEEDLRVKELEAAELREENRQVRDACLLLCNELNSMRHSAWAYHKSSISQMKFMMPVSLQVSGLHCRLAKVVIFHYGQAYLTSLAYVYKRPRTKVCFAAGL